MCGIVGYVGKKRSSNFLIAKLKKLEYRGYDSAGIASLENGEISVTKKIGKIANLENNLSENYKITCSIAHTRWATNGKVTEVNSHPHLSHDKSWAIVHNGIIENYRQLRSKLLFEAEGETDTAVVAEGLEESGAKDIFGFIDYFKDVSGGFAIVAISSCFADSLFLAKRKNPLYVSRSIDGEFLVASDPICFADFSKKYYSLGDDEFALISGGKVIFYDKNKTEIQKSELTLSNDFENADKSIYSTYMLKEIFDEESALKRQVNFYRDNNILERFDKTFLEKFNSVFLIGCGTAYHACLLGAKYFQKLLGINAQAVIASEFIYTKPYFVTKDSLTVFVSQSGETADTISAMEIAKSLGSTTLAFTNVTYSTLARLADINLPICAGVEIAVASTKAFNCQVSALYMFVSRLRSSLKNEKIDYFAKISSIAEKILHFDEFNIKNIALKIYKADHCFFIGKDIDFILSRESALKLNETTYIGSNCYPSGELKHGYLALIEQESPLFVFALQSEIRVKTLASAEEAFSRGARRIIITNDKTIRGEDTIFIDEEDELLAPILAITPMQYLACEVSRLKAIDPDEPRNLAKSVTVE